MARRWFHGHSILGVSLHVGVAVVTPNPPSCHGCGEPLIGIAVNKPDEHVWHGWCYRDYVSALWADPAVGPIGASSHDERVDDGLEMP